MTDTNSLNQSLRTRQQMLNHLKEQVTLLKEATQEVTGAFKHDFAYDEVLELLKKYNV